METNALKAVSKTDDTLTVENYIVLFGGRDLTGMTQWTGPKNPDGSAGEFFTKATDLRSPYTNTGTLYVDWEHGFGDSGEPEKDDVLGYVDWSTAEADDVGVKVQRILDRRISYLRMIEPLIEAGLIGTSSEAIPTRVSKKATGEIETWPLRRDTLTVAPFEPRMLGDNVLQAVKAVAGVWPAAKAALFDVSQHSNTGLMVALYPPADIAADIAAMPGVDVPAHELHVTIAYFGQADDMSSTQVGEIIQRTAGVTYDFAPVKGRIGGIGRFSASDSSDGKDVLYANIDCPSLEDLRRDVLWAAPPLRNHGYTPHMTLAYIDTDADMPITRWDPIPVTFDSVSIVVGDMREDFPLDGWQGKGDMVAAVEKAVRRFGVSTGDAGAGVAMPDADAVPVDIDQPDEVKSVEQEPEAGQPEGDRSSPAPAGNDDAERQRRLTLELDLLQLEE